MAFPVELMYTEEHEWVKLAADGKTALVGISEFAQSELGDIVFIGLPEVGSEVTISEAVAEIESVKSVSDIFSPVTGVISQVNADLEDGPELINADPYGAWLFEVSNISAVQENMLTAAEYETLVKEEG